MSIKPVAWTDEEEIEALAENRDCGKMWHNGAVYDAPIALYHIPDTHRVVSVELLDIIEEALHMAGEHEYGAALREIIEDKP